MLCLALSCAFLLAAGQGPIISPEVHPDHTVTFRFSDPAASKVTLNLEGADPVPMLRDSDGVWSLTTAPLRPDIYGYTFGADGESKLDPLNPETKPNLIWQSNMVLVPGDKPEPWEVRDVPHGKVEHHFYHSGVVGDDRDYFVYTPPGFKGEHLPVLYLLHGYSDMASGWTAVGKANLILDNLLADGLVKPMVIVMTLGYGISDFASPKASGFRDRDRVKLNFDNYREALFHEVMPAVEKEYGVLLGPKNTAIAGLSMGGAESLYVGLNHLDRFGWIGAFSTGGLNEDFDIEFPDISRDKVNSRLHFLYVSCGTEDGLITFNRHLVAWLNRKQVNNTTVEMTGRHTWMVWRRNLIAFTQKLFR